MDKQKQIEEIEKEYKEWAVDLLKVRFDLKPEAFDEHHKNNYSFENCADCLWNKIKEAIEQLLWFRKNQIPENAVVLTREEAVDLFNSKASGFMTSAIGDIPLNIDGMRKLVDEVSRLLIVQGELQELNAKYYNEAKDLRRKLNNDGAIYSRLEVDGFIDKTRKETAEKFAERLKDLVSDRNCNEDYDWEDVQIDGQIFVECVDEIAKELGGAE